MTRTFLKTIVCAALAAMLGVTANAQSFRRSFGGEIPAGRALRSLNLTAEQEARVDELRADFEKQTQPLRDKMEAAMKARAASGGGASQASGETGIKGRAGFREQSPETRELFAQTARLSKDAMTKFRAILTPAQQVKMDDLIAKGGERRPGSNNRAQGADRPKWNGNGDRSGSNRSWGPNRGSSSNSGGSGATN